MPRARPSRGSFPFMRDLLPAPAEYYAAQKLKLLGGGAWRNAVCPFHEDHSPSLRVRLLPLHGLRRAWRGCVGLPYAALRTELRRCRP